MQNNEPQKLLNVPNMLTLVRMLLIPVFLICYYQLPDKRYISMLVFVIASLTDCVDGYIARRTNQVTDFGKLCDPLADKLMQVSMLFCLSYDGLLAKWAWLNNAILIVMAVKELTMLIGSIFMLKKGTVVYANIFGKAATVCNCTAIVLIFPWHTSAVVTAIGQYLLLTGVCMALVAFVSYTRICVIKIKES